MKNRKLLIVDTDPKNLRILKSCFSEIGYEVEEATNDEEAVSKLAQTSYQGILTELAIDRVDGLKILHALRSRRQDDTAVFLLTPQNDVWNRVKSFKLGAKDFIIKPVHVREIVARVNMILSRQERRRQHSDRSPVFAGSLEDLSLQDLIRILGDEKKTGVLTLTNNGTQDGEVRFRDGAVISATAAGQQGEPALSYMISWRKGRFSMSFTPAESAESLGASNLSSLAEGAQRMEQREELLKQLPPLATVLTTTNNFKNIVAQKNLTADLEYFISLFDGRRSLGQIIAESTYDETTTITRIAKLYRLGFLSGSPDESTGAKAGPQAMPAQRPAPPAGDRSPSDISPSAVKPMQSPTRSWPVPTDEERVASLQHEALDSLEAEPLEVEPEKMTPGSESEETELAVQHDFADDGISELLTKDFSKWENDSGYDKDLFYELRSAAEKQPAFPAPPMTQQPADDSQLLFPTLEMLEQEHPADALLMLPRDQTFPAEEKASPPPSVRPPGLVEPPVSPPHLASRSAEQAPNSFKKAYGHVLILGSKDDLRRQMVGSLVANRLHVKEYENPDWSNLFYGISEFKGGHSLNILSLSVSKEFTGVLEYFRRSLFGYLLLIDVIPQDWNYYRYLIRALGQMLSLPSMIIVPASISLSAGLSEHEWRERLHLPDPQLLSTHVEFDPITCKRFIFKLFENYYRDHVVLQKNKSAKLVSL